MERLILNCDGVLWGSLHRGEEWVTPPTLSCHRRRITDRRARHWGRLEGSKQVAVRLSKLRAARASLLEARYVKVPNLTC